MASTKFTKAIQLYRAFPRYCRSPSFAKGQSRSGFYDSGFDFGGLFFGAQRIEVGFVRKGRRGQRLWPGRLGSLALVALILALGFLVRFIGFALGSSGEPGSDLFSAKDQHDLACQRLKLTNLLDCFRELPYPLPPQT